MLDRNLGPQSAWVRLSGLDHVYMNSSNPRSCFVGVLVYTARSWGYTWVSFCQFEGRSCYPFFFFFAYRKSGALRCYKVPITEKEEALPTPSSAQECAFALGTSDLKIKSCSSEQTRLVLKEQRGPCSQYCFGTLCPI